MICMIFTAGRLRSCRNRRQNSEYRSKSSRNLLEIKRVNKRFGRERLSTFTKALYLWAAIAMQIGLYLMRTREIGISPHACGGFLCPGTRRRRCQRLRRWSARVSLWESSLRCFQSETYLSLFVLLYSLRFVRPRKATLHTDSDGSGCSSDAVQVVSDSSVSVTLGCLKLLCFRLFRLL